jgi:pSer/pThr/pTyr-binding forkhead associated (FHA) protein
MSDPRLDGSHLEVPRQDKYDTTVNEMLDHRGWGTFVCDSLTRRPRLPWVPPLRHTPLPGGTYFLIDLADGRRRPLRVGINAIGRLEENDLILTAPPISRRHCVVLVHATGSCEVYDTVSRNGTWVNHREVRRVFLFPGDLLALCDYKFVLEWVGPNGEVFPPREATDSLSQNSW